MAGQDPMQRDRRLKITRFFIPDPTFAWFMKATAWGTLAISGFFGGLSWWYHRRLLESLGAMEMLESPEVQEMISRFARQSVTITAVASVGTVLFVTLLAWFLMHRINGPIYRLKQHLLQMVMGRTPSEVTFRRDDQLSDLSAAFNEFLRHFELIEAAPKGATDTERTPAKEDGRLTARIRT